MHNYFAKANANEILLNMKPSFPKGKLSSNLKPLIVMKIKCFLCMK